MQSIFCQKMEVPYRFQRGSTSVPIGPEVFHRIDQHQDISKEIPRLKLTPPLSRVQ
jgi:hypothetical protein